MTTTKNLSRHYDTLDPMERLRLVITAKARGDDVEVQRLRESCPRKSYTMADVEFQYRLEAREHVTHIAIIDLTRYLAKLDVVWAYAYCGPYLEAAAKDSAVVGYIQGYEEGWRAQWRALRKKGDPGQPWWEDDTFEERLDQFKTPAVIAALNGDVTEQLRHHFGRELLTVWRGFDAFCTEDLCLDGDTVMRAAFPPILDRIADKAEMLEGIEPESKAIQESADACRDLWCKFAGLES